MEKNELLKVLWVENDPKVIESYQLDAETYGLELVCYPCWDKAKEALKTDDRHWSAIILDAKCQNHKNDIDDAQVFLVHALSDIKEFSKERGKVIPWYILSGASENEFTKSILEDRMAWDKDWTESTGKVYYAKGVDNEMLYRRIKVHAENYSQMFQIHYIYNTVFDAMRETDLEEHIVSLEDLLLPIHFPNIKKDTEYNDSGFKKVRIIIESIFRSMITNGILPYFGKKVNLFWSSFLLNGKNAIDQKGNVHFRFIGSEPIIPKVMGDNLKAMSDNLPTDLHPTEGINNYLELVNQTTYLLKSYTFQLCDIILWYQNYLQTHQDVEANRKNWEKVE